MSEKNYKTTGASDLSQEKRTQKSENPEKVFLFLSEPTEHIPSTSILSRSGLMVNLSRAIEGGFMFALGLDETGNVTVALTNCIVNDDEQNRAVATICEKFLAGSLKLNASQHRDLGFVSSAVIAATMRNERMKLSYHMEDVKSIMDEELVNRIVDRLKYQLEEREITGMDNLIPYEPPYDAPYTTDFDDLMNVGYGGYRSLWNHDIEKIRDVRMLINYYQFLSNDSCKKAFERTNRDHRKTFHQATSTLLSTISSDRLCKKIPASIGNLCLVASDVANILISNSLVRGSARINYEQCREEINELVSELQFYFYGHITTVDNRP